VDTTASSNGVTFYVNNEVVAGTWVTTLSQNQVFSGSANGATQHVGKGLSSYPSQQAFGGYLAEINFVDGQAYDPSYFGETNPITGQWNSKKYTGSYGTNGFYLNFSDNSGTTATTLGKDSSGNGNNWTPNNFSVAAGGGNDSLTDTPTNNYCTWNTLDKYTSNIEVANGNLEPKQTWSGGFAGIRGTMGVTSGKWYFEFKVGSGSGWQIGWVNGSEFNIYQNSGDVAITSSGSGGFGVVWDGRTYMYGWKNNDGNTYYPNSSSYISYTTNDVIGCALDLDNYKFYFSKNGTWTNSQNPVDGTNAIIPTGSNKDSDGTYVAGDKMFPYFTGWTNGTGETNFGQRPFAGTIPAGYKTLCTENLPTPTIKEGGSYFKAKLYTGNGSTQAITGLGFSPNLVTCKRRDGSGDNQGIFDTVRGATKELNTNASGAEGTCATCVTSFDADGFTLGNNGGMNGSGETYVAWNWKESASAGFDIVSYTGTGSATTVAHNLGVVPDVVIVKNRDVADGWQIQHVAKGPTFTQQMDGAGAFEDNDTVWNDTAPTSSTFAVGTDDKTNASGEKYIAYVWSGVDGYSKFGSYVGNGNTNGNFIYTGFKPAMIWIKNIGSSENWEIWDTARDPINVVKLRMATNTDGGDVSSTFFDLVSNGVKFRNTSGGYNSSGHTFVYLCFAERAFKYANAS
jgi:hypothetical protein